MPEDIIQLKSRIQLLENILFALIRSDRVDFSKNIQLQDGRNVQLAIGTGTKFGTATNQKLGFFNATPVVQQAAISDPSGGATVDAEARTAINSLIDRLQAFGFIA